jgi:hypothetical protein
VAARDARGTRDLPMSNPGDRATLDPIDSGTPRRTMVLRPPGSANISLTRVAHSNPDRHPPSQPLHPRHTERQTREITTPPLDKRLSISGSGPGSRRGCNREPDVRMRDTGRQVVAAALTNFRQPRRSVVASVNLLVQDKSGRPQLTPAEAVAGAAGRRRRWAVTTARAFRGVGWWLPC